MPENAKEFYTMGYGVTTKEAFLERLDGISNRLGMPLSLVDIRLNGSKSLNGEWCWQGGIQTHVGLYKTIAECNLPVEYHRLPSLANDYPRTKKGLENYRRFLRYCLAFEPPVSSEDFRKLRSWIILSYYEDDNKKAIILLCTERKPFTKTGSPNCHRIILAEELLRELGDGWEVEHL